MMNGVCVIGDSHTGAIAAAERSLDQNQNSATYFAAMHNAWGDPFDWKRLGGGKVEHITQPLRLITEGLRLCPTTKELEESFIKSAKTPYVSVDDYDAFVCVDCTFSVTFLFSFAQIFRYDGLPLAKDDQSLISKACFDAAITGLLEQTWSMQIARMLRNLSTKPIYVIPEPFASRDTDESATGKAGLYTFAEKNLYSADLGKIFADACAALEERTRVRLLMQPHETVQDHIFTRRDYARSSLIERPEDDLLHCNEQWGRLVLRDLMEDLSPRRVS
jgi:hypothetical protein